MKYPQIPTPQDEMGRLTPIVTQTATGAVGPVDSGVGFAPNMIGEPMAVVINVNAIKTSAGNETYTAKVQWSDDGITWTDGTATQPLTAVGNLAFGFFSKHRFHQLVVTIAGTAPTITYEAFINALVW